MEEELPAVQFARLVAERSPQEKRDHVTTLAFKYLHALENSGQVSGLVLIETEDELLRPRLAIYDLKSQNAPNNYPAYLEAQKLFAELSLTTRPQLFIDSYSLRSTDYEKTDLCIEDVLLRYNSGKAILLLETYFS